VTGTYLEVVAYAVMALSFVFLVLGWFCMLWNRRSYTPIIFLGVGVVLYALGYGLNALS